MLPRENSLLVAATATSAISEKRTLPIAGYVVGKVRSASMEDIGPAPHS
jgi:hypothetical protein